MYMRSERFKNRTVLITGAASGIGAEAARQFAAEEAYVFGCDVNIERLATMEKELGKAFIPIHGDLRKEESVEALSMAIQQQFESLDILVNNAGIGYFSGLDFSPEDFTRHFDVNLRGPMLCVKHCRDLLEESSNPVIINISSIAANIEFSNHFLYSCAKKGIEKFTKHLVKDLPWIRANSVLPGFIDTPMLDGFGSGDEKRKLIGAINSSVPCGRIGKPIDIANAILFLASDEAAYINGASLVVDGGFTHANTWLGL